MQEVNFYVCVDVSLSDHFIGYGSVCRRFTSMYVEVSLSDHFIGYGSVCRRITSMCV